MADNTTNPDPETLKKVRFSACREAEKTSFLLLVHRAVRVCRPPLGFL